MSRQPTPRPPPTRAAVYELYYDGSGWHQDEVGATGSAGNAIVIGDGNNDSRTELFSADSDGHIYMYSRSGNSWNAQDIGNSTSSSVQSPNPMDDVAVGDGDSDGQPEVYGSAADGSVFRFAYTGSSWTMTTVGYGESGKSGSDMEALAVADADGDGRNEVYGASWPEGRIYMFRFSAVDQKWERTALVTLGSGVHALSLAAGDGNSDGTDELYAGTSNNQVYKIFYDNATGGWRSASVGSGNGAMAGLAVGSAAGDPSQKEVYAACQDGHAYQFVVDRTPPANPTVTSDTHPVPGTWYTANIVHVMWKDAGGDISGFDGYSYSWDNSPSTVPDAKKDVEESVHDATSPALSPGKWYFHIRARDNALNWNATATTFGPICIGSEPDTVPPVISDVRVSGITDRLAVVSWTTNEPADSAVDYGATTAYGQKVQDAAFVLEHSVTLTGLAASATYHFKAGSKDASGNGPTESGDLSFTTLAAPDTTPPAISNIKVSGVTDRVAVVSWVTDEPADSAVECGATASYGLSVSDDNFVTVHELTLTGLNASTLYHFRVLSTDATGNGPAASLDLTFSTVAQPDRTPPAISGVGVEGITATTATIIWDTDEVADSFVEYGTTGTFGLSSADRSLATAHSVTLLGLQPDTIYHFRVQSADSSGNTATGANSTFRTAKTPAAPDRTPPVISGLLVSGISDTRAVVLWSTDELADSAVEYGTTAIYGQRGGDAADTILHSVVLEGLKPTTTYHLRAESEDVSGNGPAMSGDINFTTAGNPDKVPPGISNMKVTNITLNGATITWTTDEPADGVVVYGNSTAYGRRLSSRLNVLSHSIVISGLSPGRVYHFRVNSTDPAGNAASPSADRTFTTLKGGVTTAAENLLFWPVILLTILAAVVLGVGAFAYWRYGRKGQPEPTPSGIAPAKAAPAAGTAAASAPAEEVETLQMDDGVQAGAGDPWLEEGATAAALVATAAALRTGAIGPGPLRPGRPEGLPGLNDPQVVHGLGDQRSPAAPPKPVEPVPVRHIRCPKCRTRIPLYTDGPARILCPNCGTTGEYRPKGLGAGSRVQGAGVTTGLAAATTKTPAASTLPPVPRPDPVAPAGTAAPVRMTRCSNCGSSVPIYTTNYPVRITCPGCGKTGIYRGPRS
jgi:predicted RNA-binding Zn-ribbon protein involved in translation (DUF1610 family)